MLIRPFEKRDLVWLKPIALKYQSWNEVQRIANEPNEVKLVTAMVIAPYCAGCIVIDDHGAVLDGLTDTYGIRRFIRLGEFFCKMADDCKLDLHNHKGQKDWERRVLNRLGFIESPELGWIRYIFDQPAEEVV